MDERTDIGQATSVHITLLGFTPKSSIPEAGWNSGECTGSLFMAEAASIHSEYIVPPGYDEKDTKKEPLILKVPF